jgi:hypothetical protein
VKGHREIACVHVFECPPRWERNALDQAHTSPLRPSELLDDSKLERNIIIEIHHLLRLGYWFKIVCPEQFI